MKQNGFTDRQMKKPLKNTYEGDSNTITEIPSDNKWIVTNVELTDIKHFGGWTEATEKHFADGGVFDQIYEK